MKHQIIEIDEYLLVVDEGEIKGWYYDAYINKVKHSGGAEYGESIITRNIIAHLPLNGSPALEGVDLLPPLPLVEDDVEKLAKMYCQEVKKEIENHSQHTRIGILGGSEVGFKQGYNQAKEKYNLTLEKILDLYIQETGYGMDMWSKEENAVMSVVSKIIQSLSQPKMPIGFEFEASKSRPVFNGEPKTKWNMAGFTRWTWEGKYIYE